jgi:hypothetical protein
MQRVVVVACARAYKDGMCDGGALCIQFTVAAGAVNLIILYKARFHNKNIISLAALTK